MDGRSGWDGEAPRGGPLLSRRALLRLGGTSALALALAACTDDAPEAVESPTPSASPVAEPGDPVGPDDAFALLRELRDALRASPDHRVGRAARLVVEGDPQAITAFVVSEIATLPPTHESWGSGATSSRRWGTYATLRGGAGTPRERADLLAELLTEAGFVVEVVLQKVDDPLPILTRPRGYPAFAPALAPERLGAIRDVLGIELQALAPPVDVDGVDAARLGGSLLGLLGEDAVASRRFDAAVPSHLPMVRVLVDGTAMLADPFSDGALAPEPEGLRAAGDASPTDDLTVALAVAIDSDPATPMTVVEATWPVDALAGHQVQIGFAPALADPLEVLRTAPADVTTYIPTLLVSSPHLTPLTQEFAVTGEPVTQQGLVIDTGTSTGAPGTGGGVTVGDAVLTGDGDPTAVTTLELVSVNGAAFPSVETRVRALDASGAEVLGLPASAFTLAEEGAGRSFVLERSAPPVPRVLFLLDASSSVPDGFRGAGGADIVRGIAERVADGAPGALFHVAAVGDGEADDLGAWTDDVDALARDAERAFSIGSRLWAALADSRRYRPNVVVFVTDGANTDADGEPAPASSEQLGRVATGAPVVLVGVGDGRDADQLRRMADVSGGAVTLADDPAATVDVVVELIDGLDVGTLVLRHDGLTEGPTTRTVEVSVGAITVGESYDVPLPDERVVPPAIVGIHLTVALGSQEVTRTLAGVPLETTIGRQVRAATLGDVAACRRALWGSFQLSVEGSAIGLGQQLDDAVTTMLSYESLLTAATPDEQRAALEAGVATVPHGLYTASVPLRGAAPITFEVGPRLTLLSSYLAPGTAESDRAVQVVDVLPLTRFATADTDPVSAFATTAGRTARLALSEAAAYDTSTTDLLDGTTLVVAGDGLRAALGDGDADEAVVDAFERLFRGGFQNLPGIVPAGGAPVAGWTLDRETGTLLGLLADGSGGGASVDDINATFDRAASSIDTFNAVAGTLSFLGVVPGLSFAAGVWLELEKTKLEKLRAATIMLATLDAPEGDISDLSGLACSLATSAATTAATAGAARVVDDGGKAFGAGMDAIGVADGWASLLGSPGIMGRFCA